jgi:hypothetical protein
MVLLKLKNVKDNKMREPYKSIAYKVSQGWNDHLQQVPSELLEAYSDAIVKECMRLCKTAVGPQDYNTGRMHCMDNIHQVFMMNKESEK